jgi:hypothetical protein
VGRREGAGRGRTGVLRGAEGRFVYPSRSARGTDSRTSGQGRRPSPATPHRFPGVGTPFGSAAKPTNPTVGRHSSIQTRVFARAWAT